MTDKQVNELIQQYVKDNDNDNEDWRADVRRSMRTDGGKKRGTHWYRDNTKKCLQGDIGKSLALSLNQAYVLCR